jgi:hypothetical protein
MSRGHVKWIKSTRCENATCVEVGRDDSRPHTRLIRDSKAPHEPAIVVTTRQFTNFIEWVKSAH